jgi:hypothetical protein
LPNCIARTIFSLSWDDLFVDWVGDLWLDL